jgi:hypothetical protein
VVGWTSYGTRYDVPLISNATMPAKALRGFRADANTRVADCRLIAATTVALPIWIPTTFAAVHATVTGPVYCGIRPDGERYVISPLNALTAMNSALAPPVAARKTTPEQPPAVAIDHVAGAE